MSNINKRVIYSNREEFYNCTDECKEEGMCHGDCDLIVLQDELMNLNIKLPGKILAIADIGRWNGRFSGYKILPNNAKHILQSDSDYVEWYSDGKNIKATMSHHDGTNYVEYRVIREGRNIENLTKKLYNQEAVTRQMINYYTESLAPYIHKVYGW